MLIQRFKNVSLNRKFYKKIKSLVGGNHSQGKDRLLRENDFLNNTGLFSLID